MEQEQKTRASRPRRYHIVAMRLDRDKWLAYVAMNRDSGGSASASIREHIEAALSEHEARKADSVLADDLENFISNGGSDAE